MRRRADLRAIGSLSAAIAGLAVLGGCLFSSPPAPTPTRVRRVGYLASGTRATLQAWADAFIKRLRQLRWVHRDNVSIVWRFGDGRKVRLVPSWQPTSSAGTRKLSSPSHRLQPPDQTTLLSW